MTELGIKHECVSCSTKFYDLGRSEIICPQCGADQKELAEADADSEPAAKKNTRAKKRPTPDENDSHEEETIDDEKIDGEEE